MNQKIFGQPTIDDLLSAITGRGQVTHTPSCSEQLEIPEKVQALKRQIFSAELGSGQHIELVEAGENVSATRLHPDGQRTSISLQEAEGMRSCSTRSSLLAFLLEGVWHSTAPREEIFRWQESGLNVTVRREYRRSQLRAQQIIKGQELCEDRIWRPAPDQCRSREAFIEVDRLTGESTPVQPCWTSPTGWSGSQASAVCTEHGTHLQRGPWLLN